MPTRFSCAQFACVTCVILLPDIAVPADYTSPESIAAITSTVALPPFTPRSIVIKASEADNVEDGAADDDAAAVTSLAAELTAASKTPALAALKDRLAPADFEKDDDSNGHIGFITGESCTIIMMHNDA